MGYKIPDLPSAKAYLEEKADFWEIQALRNEGNPYSQINATRSIARGLDEIFIEGLIDEDDQLDENFDYVLGELGRREKACEKGYPFILGKYSLRYDDSVNEDQRMIYLFMLLCTRFKMNHENKIQAEIDGTLLFEELCSEVAKKYFGEKSKSWVFGTATPGNFQNKVGHMIKKIGEGDGFKNPDNCFPKKNDDGIDVVVWRDFADERRGKMIGFGQCKTGTSWKEEIKKFNPNKFCDHWLKDKPILPPIPMIFICDTLNSEYNLIYDQRGNLVFNRFRIMEYLPDHLDPSILSRIIKWVEAALQKLK